MAIVRKPKRDLGTKQDEVAVLKVINKGLSVPEPGDEGNDNEEISTIIRLSKGTLKRVDKARGKRQVKTPRNTWFVEAILAKLEAEGG